MGMYGEVEIIATYETEEQASKVLDNLNDKIVEFIKETTEHKVFDFSLGDWDIDGCCIILKIYSGRVQNAEWQGEQVLNYMKTTEGLYEFTADVITPENFLWWNKDEEE